MQPRGDLQQRLWEMMATPRGSRTAKGGVWALRSKSSRCESLVGPPQVVQALGKPGKAWESQEGQHGEGAGCPTYLVFWVVPS